MVMVMLGHYNRLKGVVDLVIDRGDSAFFFRKCLCVRVFGNLVIDLFDSCSDGGEKKLVGLGLCGLGVVYLRLNVVFVHESDKLAVGHIRVTRGKVFLDFS